MLRGGVGHESKEHDACLSCGGCCAVVNKAAMCQVGNSLRGKGERCHAIGWTTKTTLDCGTMINHGWRET